MKFELELQDGVYFLDVYYVDTLKKGAYYPYGTIVFDIKRQTYYLIPSEKSEIASSFIEIMENLFISNLVPKDDYGYPKFNSGSRTGELSNSVQEKLMNLLELYDIKMPKTLESQNDEKYYHLLNEYNLGYYPESKMM